MRRFAWWYICIGAGFAVLAVRAYLLGAPGWGTALRAVVAAGFVLLGISEWRRFGPRR